MRVLVVADRGDSDPGFVGERLEQLGGELTTLFRSDQPTAFDAGDASLVLLLGSANGVAEAGRGAAVAAESALVLDCLDRGVPVIAICYGAQLAAHALGGTVGKAAEPEIGWYYVESHDPALCPPGPWVQFHYDTFTVPEGARPLGRSDAGPQGFAIESPESAETFRAGSGGLRLVAWQFHPEVTPVTLARWVSEDAAALPAVGVDGAAMVAEAHQREQVSRAATHALVDVTLGAMGLVALAP